MKAFLLYIILIFWHQFAFAQPPSIEWQKCFGGTQGDGGEGVNNTYDNGFIIVGVAGSNDGDVMGGGFHGYGDFWVTKLDSAGNIQWQKCYGGSEIEQAYSVFQTNDNGYIISGFTNSSNGDISSYVGTFPNNDCWVIKIDSIGNLEWERCYGGTKEDFTESIIQTSDGGYIFAGFTLSNDYDVSGNHSTDTSDAWVVKLDSNGNIIWQKCLGGSEEDKALKVIETAEGTFMVIGHTFSNDGDITNNHGTSTPDYWLVKLDSAGNILWQKCFGGIGYDFGTSLVETLDNGFAIAGFSGSIDGDVTSGHGSFDYWVAKLANNGSLLWEKTYGGSYHDWAWSIIATSDSGFVIAGQTDSNDGDVIGYHSNVDYWIVKTDSIGNIQWQKCLGGNSNDYLQAVNGIIQSTSGAYVLIGSSNSSDGDVSGLHSLYFDSWVVKLSTNAVGTFDQFDAEQNFSCILNPVTHNLHIAFSAKRNKRISIQLFDLTSRLIYEQTFSSIEGNNEQEIQLMNFSPGFYFVRMVLESRIETKIFIKN